MTLRGIMVLGCLLGSLAGAAAQEAVDTSSGEALYARYCATCHGPTAGGDGPTAAFLTVQPPDLSALSEANMGKFPVSRLIRRIDGRETVVAHGSPMPIYGAFFDGSPETMVDTESGQDSVSLPVLEIVEYLRTLQR
ncbi:c-type cytochrome [Tropicimonas aquimaris]|uniref:C-type cytochrome n=1 Tax=Tropicimonas aquimaris TaxID=914152 RepID=A0ABW3IRX4_9RHOB